MQKRIKHPRGWKGQKGWRVGETVYGRDPLKIIPEYSGDIELGWPSMYARDSSAIRLFALEDEAGARWGVPLSNLHRATLHRESVLSRGGNESELNNSEALQREPLIETNFFWNDLAGPSAHVKVWRQIISSEVVRGHVKRACEYFNQARRAL